MAIFVTLGSHTQFNPKYLAVLTSAEAMEYLTELNLEQDFDDNITPVNLKKDITAVVNDSYPCLDLEKAIWSLNGSTSYGEANLPEFNSYVDPNDFKIEEGDVVVFLIYIGNMPVWIKATF
jgi:hypothetical protein